MNWEALGAIAETLGAIAVFATLVYLAIQIRQNTKALNTASFQHDADQFNRLNMSVAENPQLAKALSKAFTSTEDLDESEMMQVSSYLIANFHIFETLYFGFNEGTVPEELWRAEERGLRTLINAPIVSTWWDNILKVGPYTESFRDHVESLRGTMDPSDAIFDLLATEDAGYVLGEGD